MKTTLTLLFLNISISFFAQQSLADSLGLNPLKKKDKKREIYIGFYKPYFSAETEKTRSGLLFSDVAEDSTYYSYQSYRSHNVKITGYRGLSIGFNKKWKLTERIYFKSGLGINIFGMGYDKSYIEDSIRIITKFKRIKDGTDSQTQTINVNDYIDYSSNTKGPYILNSPYQFLVNSLQIPIAAEIMISPKLYVGGGVNYNFVITGQIYSYTTNDLFPDKSYRYYNTNLISRVYATLDFHIKYNVYKNLFIDLNGAYVGNVFNKSFGNNTSFFGGVRSIAGYNFGFRFGYNF